MYNLFSAHDPEVWENPSEFCLRDMKTYKENSMLFAEPMKDEENIDNRRYCPGKSLALNMITSFITAFLKKKAYFTYNSNDVYISDKLNAAGDPMKFSKEWE